MVIAAYVKCRESKGEAALISSHWFHRSSLRWQYSCLSVSSSSAPVFQISDVANDSCHQPHMLKRRRVSFGELKVRSKLALHMWFTVFSNVVFFVVFFLKIWFFLLCNSGIKQQQDMLLEVNVMLLTSLFLWKSEWSSIVWNPSFPQPSCQLLFTIYL